MKNIIDSLYKLAIVVAVIVAIIWLNRLNCNGGKGMSEDKPVKPVAEQSLEIHLDSVERNHLIDSFRQRENQLIAEKKKLLSERDFWHFSNDDISRMFTDLGVKYKAVLQASNDSGKNDQLLDELASLNVKIRQSNQNYDSLFLNMDEQVALKQKELDRANKSIQTLTLAADTCQKIQAALQSAPKTIARHLSIGPSIAIWPKVGFGGEADITNKKGKTYGVNYHYYAPKIWDFSVTYKWNIKF